MLFKVISNSLPWQKHRAVAVLGVLLTALLSASSCSSTKNLPQGDNLYTGSSVKVTGEDKKATKGLSAELQGLLRPKPNTKVLGVRYKLHLYNLAGTKPVGKGLRGWLKNKVGEPPVLASEVNIEKNRLILQNRLENKGFFHAVVTADTTVKGRKMSAEYEAIVGPQYHIRTTYWPEDSSDLSKAIVRANRRTLLDSGTAYNLDVIRAERARIDANLKNNGFYYFNPEYLYYLVDTNQGGHELDMYLAYKPDMPQKSREIYYINDIWVYPTYAVEKDSLLGEAPAINAGKFNIIDPDNLFKPKVFERTLIFEPGDKYSRRDHNLALSRLVNIGTFKFVKARFEEVDTAGNFLDPYYFLTPLPRKSFSATVTGLTKSNNATGSELELAWRNRNLLRGAELFTISGFVGAEQQVSGNVSIGTFRYGLEANMYVPYIIAPFRLQTPNEFVPKTRFNLAYELYTRTDQYTLNSIRASYGFVWKENVRKEHQLNVLSLNYVRPLKIDPLFQARIDTDITLARSIEPQFILGPNYNFNFNTLLRPRRRSHHDWYFNGNVDLPGNILGIISGSEFNKEKQGNGKILGTIFSQYVRFEAEGRHYYRLGDSKDNKIVSRVLGGIGIPYGNSERLPFIKTFFIGGVNSIRAFRARSLGPGTYYVRAQENAQNRLLPDQPGDIKIEVNTELRAKLVSVVHGAVFVDAGNIWTLEEDPERPGSKFTNKFLQQFAVGAGLGIRFDISFLVVRVDLATPIRKPYLLGSERESVKNFDFGNADYRKENLVLNLAIGYPF